MKKVLLHICCMNCAVVCIQRLKQEGFSVYGFFYNPNISPKLEYQKRKEDLARISASIPFEIIDSNYEPIIWRQFIRGHEQDQEGSGRCKLCFELRLKQAYRVMSDYELDFFTTTLTISPHKDSKVIESMGTLIGGDRFLVRDFKKKDGFRESVERSRSLGLYRQNYCGCEYSKKSD